jgi:hypothetical protein
MNPDSDFKQRSGHVRGQGVRGLIALAIWRLPTTIVGTAVLISVFTLGPLPSAAKLALKWLSH